MVVDWAGCIGNQDGKAVHDLIGRHAHAIEVAPLSPNIGAEISGLDLSQPLGNQAFAEVHDALMTHQVIFFRDQIMDWEQHKAFGRRFGELLATALANRVDIVIGSGSPGRGGQAGGGGRAAPSVA